MISRVCSTSAFFLLSATLGFSQQQGYVSAKKLFYAEPETTTKPVKKPIQNHPIRRVPASFPVPVLRYKVIQKVEEAREIVVDPDRVFHSRDRIRFEFESNVEGYLCVLQEGSSGRWSVLFPDSRINEGSNHIQRRQPYLVPSGKWFVFNDVPGTEHVTVFLTTSPVKDLPTSANGAQPIDPAIINELNSSLKSRDMVFEKDQEFDISRVETGAMYAVNKNADENGRAIVVSILLKHMQ